MRKLLLFFVACLLLPFTHAALTDGLVSYYSFNNADINATHVLDVHGSNHGLINGLPSTGVSAYLGEGFEFSGTGQYVNIGHVNELDAAPLTVVAWVNVSLPTTGIEEYPAVVHFGNTGFHFYVNSIGEDRLTWHYPGVAQVNSSDQPILNNGFVMLVLNVTSDTFGVGTTGYWINNTRITEIDISGGGTASYTGDFYLGFNDDSVDYFNGIFDDIGLWNRTLTEAELTTLWNGGVGNPYPFSVGLNVSLSTPADGSHTNTNPVNFTFNGNASSGFVNYTLYVDGLANKTILNQANGDAWINTTLSEGSHTWLIQASSGGTSINSSSRTIIFDPTSPVWTVNPSNFFNASNTTVLNIPRDGDNHSFNLTLTDTYVFGFNISIVAANGTRVYENVTTNLTSSVENFTNTLNLSSYKSQEYTVFLFGEDDHTANSIPYYYTQSISNGHQWVTEHGTTIQIVSNGFTLTTNKLIDRYTFTASRAGGIAPSFTLRSSQPLFYRGDLYSFPSFVTGKHWVDFDTPSAIGTPTVQDNGLNGSFYEYTITYPISASLLSFSSLGGLNNATQSHTFIINNTPRQVENLSANTTGVSWVNLSWDLPAEASGVTLFNGSGNQLYNNSNGSNWFNITGLSSGTTYNFLVWAFYNESGTLLYNTSNSAENNNTFTTLFNNTLSLTVRNDVTQELITNARIFINLISETFNLSGNTTTGSLLFSNVMTENYTIRHSGVGWGLRDQKIALTGNTNNNVTLYLLNDSVRDNARVSVEDTRSNTVSGAIVKLLRYYGSCNCYELVETMQTGTAGEGIMSVQFYEAFYKWIVEFDGVTKHITSIPENIFPQTDGLGFRAFTIDNGNNIYTSFKNTDKTGGLVTHNNLTNTLSFTWNDNTGLVSAGCLSADYASGASWLTLGPNCTSGSVGSTLLQLQPNVTYAWNAYYETNSIYSDTVFANGVIENIRSIVFGNSIVLVVGIGLYVGVALLLSFSAVGVAMWTVVILIASLALNFVGQAVMPVGIQMVVAVATLLVGMSVYLLRR